ncbi:MAG: MFS transporter [Parcubacteria group bacterium]|nr:MFS transporter [Parcubacteria group bacterium]
MAPKKHNKIRQFLLITNGLIFLAEAMLGPIYALFIADVGGSILNAGIAGGVFAVVAGTLTLVVGKASDWSGSRRVFVGIGYAIIGLGFALYTLVDSFATLLIVEAVIGAGQAVYAPPFSALYSQHLDFRHPARQWGVWEAMTYYTTAVGSVAGAVIASKYGFDALFVLMSGLAFASAITVLWKPQRANVLMA